MWTNHKSSNSEHDVNEQGIRYHWGLLLCVFGLMLFGSVMVYSATTMFFDSAHHVKEPTGFMLRHFINILIGLVAMGICLKIPMSTWSRIGGWRAFWISVVLAILVLVPGIGVHVKGATRWIHFPLVPFNLQVSELIKVLCLFFAAQWVVLNQRRMHSFFKVFMPFVIFVFVVGGLLMIEPDLGATVVITAELMGVLFIGGLVYWIFGFVSAGVILLVVSIILATPWRLQRLLAYLDPWDPNYVLDIAYQLTHSLIAFGRGELFGVGVGNSIEKLYYLPEAHTDFILAVIAEETGFIGILIIMFLYYWLVRYCFEIGRQAIKLERHFSGLFAQGVGVWFGVQSIINIGVASGAFPTKGLTLPFVSYGGSAVLIGLATIGILLRIDRENKILMQGGRV